MGDDRPNVYREGDQWIIRASAIGGCMRSLVAAGRDVEPNATPEWMQEKFDEGKAAEPIIAEWYHTKNSVEPLDEEWAADHMKHLARVDGQWEFNLQVRPNIVVRGHFDDIVCEVVGKGETFTDYDFIGVEYKAVGKDLFAQIANHGAAAKATYEWQVGCYMAATNLPWDFVAVLKNEDGTVTEIVDHTTRYYTIPPVMRTEIEDRALEVIDWVENRAYDEYPPCALPLQYPCPYFLLHDEEEIPVLEGDEADRMRSALDLRQQLKNRIVLMNDQVKTADETIKMLLGDRKTVMVDGTRVTWVHSESPEKWIEPKPYMKKASVSDYPKITPPKEKKE